MITLKESILSSTNSGIPGMKDKIARFEFEPYMVSYLEKQVAFYKVRSRKELRDVILAYLNIAGNECSLNWIDTSRIVDMSGIFRGTGFNGKIDKWNTSNVKNMYVLFWGAYNFNQDISGWDVSKVDNMKCMFLDAESFNQDISNWKIKLGCQTEGVFFGCHIKEEYKPDGLK